MTIPERRSECLPPRLGVNLAFLVKRGVTASNR
jgi:hypothetical protein